MYYIIGEVGSEAMRLEEEQALAGETLSPPRTREKMPLLTRIGLGGCFRGPEFYAYDFKEIETIPMTIDDEENEDFTTGYERDDYSIPEGEERTGAIQYPALASFAINYQMFSMYPSQSRRGPKESKVMSKNGRCTGSWESDDTDHRDDCDTLSQPGSFRESLQCHAESLLVQESWPVLGVAFPHPGTSYYSNKETTLGIDSPHPSWLGQQLGDSWDQDDESPIDYVHISSLDLSYQSEELCAEGLEEEKHPSVANANKESFTKNCKQQQVDSSWARALYEPIFRIAKELTACGQLEDDLSTLDQAPFDEVKQDRECAPYDELDNDFAMRTNVSVGQIPNRKFKSERGGGSGSGATKPFWNEI